MRDNSDLLGFPVAPGDLIHISELADLIGLTAGRIQTLTRDGVIQRAGPATYSRRESVRAYCAQLRAGAARAGRPSEGGDALKLEKTRLAREQADKLEAQNAAARAELIPAAEVERAWSGILRDVRTGMLTIPSRAGQRLNHLTPHDLSEIDHAVRAALSEAAGGDDAP